MVCNENIEHKQSLRLVFSLLSSCQKGASNWPYFYEFIDDHTTSEGKNPSLSCMFKESIAAVLRQVWRICVMFRHLEKINCPGLYICGYVLVC